MFKVTLDFEDETAEWETDTQHTIESYPGLSKRKDSILEAIGAKMHDMSTTFNAVNALINGQITGNEFSRILDEEIKNESSSLSLLPKTVKAINVLIAAKETYMNYGDEAYANGKASSFLRRCGVKVEYGTNHPIHREVIEKVVHAALDDESGELFFQILYRRLEDSQESRPHDN